MRDVVETHVLPLRAAALHFPFGHPAVASVLVGHVRRPRSVTLPSSSTGRYRPAYGTICGPRTCCPAAYRCPEGTGQDRRRRPPPPVRPPGARPEINQRRRTRSAQEVVPAAEVRAKALTAGASATVLVQTATVAEETAKFLAQAADSRTIGAVVDWTDLTSPRVGDELARLRPLPGGAFLHGIRHQAQSQDDPQSLPRPQVLRGLHAVAAAGLVYDLVVLPHQLPAATRAAAVPHLTFILDHLGKPPTTAGQREPWAQYVREPATLPNTVCKLSGILTKADWAARAVEGLQPCADTVLDAFGPRRLMCGTGRPVSTVTASYSKMVAASRELTAALSTTEQQKAQAGTARHAYRIEADRSR
ncbi:amidohydrolase family protein [Streptomyces sp. NPDC051020]|uniref:amidohydrolase family protein n=1 Tax=Streptomyces sp. NPDC051020 TaxID=3155409 RepID=UPI00341D990D